MNKTPISNLPVKKIKVGSTSINVEIARTVPEQTLGLSGRENLDPNSGLYFEYDKPANKTIWMKDMKFTIDVIWIRAGVVVEITENIVPQGMGMPIVTSKEPADAFIELNTGFAKKNNLKVGDKVVFQ